MLLDEFERLGLHCDAAKQLVVVCEVCGRPATTECWTCKMRICEFCTLKRHWKVRRAQRQRACALQRHRRAAAGAVPARHWGRSLPSLSPVGAGRQGAVGLHWPLIESDRLRERLGRAQLEDKRLADCKRCAGLFVHANG